MDGEPGEQYQPRYVLDHYLREWAGGVMPFASALGLRPRTAVFARGFGEMAVGDIESGLTHLWLGMMSGIFKF